MNTLSKRIIFGVVGLLLVYGWWTYQGWRSGSHTPSTSKIPAQLWEGGGGSVTIEAEANDPATLHAYFASVEKAEPGEPKRSLEALEKVEAGQHSWTIDVPPATRGSLEFEAVGPKPGSKLSWSVRAGQKPIAQDADTLKSPLQANEAFFLQVQVADFATGKLEGEE